MKRLQLNIEYANVQKKKKKFNKNGHIFAVAVAPMRIAHPNAHLNKSAIC